MRKELKKLHKDILVEWTYDRKNVILEPYRILRNSRDLSVSYQAFDSTITGNSQENQLFPIDQTVAKYAKVDTADSIENRGTAPVSYVSKKYNFLSYTDLVSERPIRHDICKIYLPANYTFEEYQGIYLRIYTYDYQNKKFYNLSNFFYDKNDASQSYLLKTGVTPLLYQNILWSKYIELHIPSVYSTARDRRGGVPILGSLNSTLTNFKGLSQTSPIFIDFRFIARITQVGQTKNYILTRKSTFQLPQTPQLDELQLYMGESKGGDYFEIYPTFNNRFERFITFMEESKTVGKNYYLEFDVTVFEENIRGKTYTYRIENDFNEIIDFRPVIKYATTSAVIDVEMRLINRDGNDIITRKASYGMIPDQLSKYLVNLKKINVRNVFKPKIYVKEQFNRWPIDELGISDSSLSSGFVSNSTTKSVDSNKEPALLEDNSGNPKSKLEVPVPELSPIIQIGLTQISAYSKQALNKVRSSKIDNYHFIGRLKIGVRPFDNIYKFHLAFRVGNTLERFDLTNCNELKLVIRTDSDLFEFPQFFSQETVAKLGFCQFKIPERSFLNIKQSLSQGFNIFYIVNTNVGITTVIYSGLYIILDTVSSLNGGSMSDLLDNINGRPGDSGDGSDSGSGIIDPPQSQEFAIVTRKRVPISKNTSSGKSSGKGTGGSSTYSGKGSKKG